MKIATVTAGQRGHVDAVLTEVAERLTHGKFLLAGVVKARPERRWLDPCDMDLALLPFGRPIRISRNLGSQSSSCRLDAGALEEAAVAVEATIANEPVDLLVINKFGQREAEGYGLRAAIAAALERGIPVLIGVPEGHRAAFARFADGLSEALPPEVDAVLTWCRAARAVDAM